MAHFKKRTTVTNPSITLGSNATLGAAVAYPGPGTAADGGHILQVSSNTCTAIVSSTTQNWNDIDSTLVCSITCASSSNKVIVMWNCGAMADYGGWTPVTRVVRNQPSGTTVTTIGTSGTGAKGISISPGYSSSGAEHCGTQNAFFVDAPGTVSAIEYKMQWYGREDSSLTNRINAQAAGNDQAYYGCSISTLTLMEIKV